MTSNEYKGRTKIYIQENLLQKMEVMTTEPSNKKIQVPKVDETSSLIRKNTM